MLAVMKLERDFFAQPTLQVARQILGTRLIFNGPNGLRSGIITETEAYIGPEDKASHASRGRTPRTEPMFGPPGLTYVYLIYGMYHCLNIVTEAEGYPAAILIRGLVTTPTSFEDELHLNGPGKVCRWLGINRSHNQIDATGDILYFEKITNEITLNLGIIKTGPRIGVDYAGVWAAKPWRFYLANRTQNG